MDWPLCKTVFWLKIGKITGVNRKITKNVSQVKKIPKFSVLPIQNFSSLQEFLGLIKYSNKQSFKDGLESCFFIKDYMAPWCSGYHYCLTSFNKAWTQVLCRFESCLRCVRDSQWWGSLTMVPTGNKAKHLSSVNHTTKTIHHHHHQHIYLNSGLWSNFLRKTTITTFYFAAGEKNVCKRKE